MNVKQLACLLIPIITLSTSAPPDTAGDSDDAGKSFIISAHEESSAPGGFSSVAEPAGPVDPEAAKRAAEKYHFHCVTMPKLVAFFDKTEIVTPPGMHRPSQHRCSLGRRAYHGQ